MNSSRVNAAQETPLSRWLSTVENLSWSVGQLDASTFECFKVAVSEGIARDEAFSLAQSRIRAAGDRLRGGKLERQWMAAIKWVARHGCITSPDVDSEQSQQPSVDYNRIDKIVRSGCGIYDLWEQSPIRFCDDQAHTEEIIDTIFPGNPWLCVGIGKYKFTTQRRETFRGELAAAEFIVAQPMSSQFGLTSEDQPSQHSLQNTGPRKHWIIDFDFCEKDKTGKDTEWAELVRGWTNEGISVTDACAALLDYFSLFAPLGLVLHSAGKSCHGWFPCAGATQAQIESFTRDAFALGADPQLFRNKSQFVRMPDGTRSDNGQRQVTYFFDQEVFHYGTEETR